MKTTAVHVTSGEPGSSGRLSAGDGKLDFILRQIDLISIAIVFLGICLLGLLAAGIALVQLALLITNHWAQPADRWLMIILASALIWVVVRWKKSSLC